jgi:hypothetical protein
MPTPDWVDYKDRCYGHADPGGEFDTYNKATKGFWKNFSAYDSGTGEHNRDGTHMADLTDNVYVLETGTYTGNGTDDRNISLSDSGLDIKYIRIFEESTQGTWFRSETMAGDATLETKVMSSITDAIQSVSTPGVFQVGLVLNVNLRVYYYILYGES